MKRFDNQIKRIQSKLVEARKQDKSLNVFGASKHKYAIGEKINLEVILKFENQFNIQLPDCYKTFLTQIGNGGNSNLDSAAGPFYGIYPLGENIDELVESAQLYLSKEVKIYPTMSKSYWQELVKKINEDEEISDEEYDQELGNIFSGILPIGSQGCTYFHGIILNGNNKGKVVNLDISMQKPKFTYEDNFLDWYERWLDEIISGDLLQDGSNWFGYSKGGSEEILVKEYSHADLDNKLIILNGILNKKLLNKKTYNFLEQEYLVESNEKLRRILLEILFKSDKISTKKYLEEFGEKELLAVFQFVYWYDKKNSKIWLEFIQRKIELINDEETFRFCTYLLQEMKIDFAELIIPFTSNKNYKIRKIAYYSLGKLKDKSDHIEIFIRGLKDKSNEVVHITLQALDKVNNSNLLQHYKQVADKYPSEENYILANLNHRLKYFNLNDEQLRNMSYQDLEQRNKKKWYEIWKK